MFERLRELFEAAASTAAAMTAASASAASGATGSAANGAGATSPGGLRLDPATGEIDLGHLEPTGTQLELPTELAHIVRSPEAALDVGVINTEYNPFREEPKGADGRPLVGPFASPARIFTGKAFLRLGDLVTPDMLPEGVDKAALGGVLPMLNIDAALETPAHQFRVPSGIGNRIVLYGGSIGHSHIDAVTAALGRRHMRLLKQMVHLDLPCNPPNRDINPDNPGPFGKGAQGGSFIDILKDGVGGSTHVGGFSAGHVEGHPATAKSDWPADYGTLLDPDYIRYNAHLFAIDYAAGTREPIPEPALAAYKRNADMWDCCAGMLVPFTEEGELDPRFTDFAYNPLEITDQRSARAVAAALARFDQRTFLIEHGAFYCSEGQYCIANLGPQEDTAGGTLLKRSRFGNTPFGRLIDAFAAAPGYAAMPLGERRRRPEIGWAHLKALGPGDGGITPAQHQRLVETDRHSVHLEWIPEDVPGWQAYRPLHGDGLIARPMTVATMVWGHFRRYLPREQLARIIAGHLAAGYAVAPADMRAAIRGLTRGEDPATPAGKAALSMASAQLATLLIHTLLGVPELRQVVLKQAGFEEIAEEADRARVLALYEELRGIVLKAALAPQADFDTALMEADRRCGAVEVTRKLLDKRNGGERLVKTTLMRYAAPACFVMWAQQPFLAETGCIRYVATAMHVNQARPELRG